MSSADGNTAIEQTLLSGNCRNMKIDPKSKVECIPVYIVGILCKLSGSH